MQDSNQSKVYAEFKKWHIHYGSGSLEDKLDYLFSKPVQQPVLLQKYFACVTLYPRIVKGDLDYSRFPEGNLKRNEHLIHLDDKDNFQSK